MTCECTCNRPKRQVYGTYTLANGCDMNWLQFIESADTQEEAETLAMEIVQGQHAGNIKKIWITDNEFNPKYSHAVNS